MAGLPITPTMEHPGVLDAIVSLVEAKLDVPMEQVPWQDQDVPPTLRRGRTLLSHPGANLYISIETEYTMVNGVVDMVNREHELVNASAWRVLGCLRDSRGDICIAVHVVFYPQDDMETQVLFLYEKDLITCAGQLRIAVEEGEDAPNYGIQWLLDSDPSAGQPMPVVQEMDAAFNCYSEVMSDMSDSEMSDADDFL